MTFDPNSFMHTVDIGGGVRRNVFFQDSLVQVYDKNIQTLYELFQDAVKKYPERNYLGARSVDSKGQAGPYHFLTYMEAGEQVKRIASGLQSHLKTPSRNIGLYSKNRVEWFLTEQACYARNLVPVALYDSLGQHSIEFICRQAQIELVFTTSDKVANLVKSDLPIKTIVLMDNLKPAAPPKDGIQVVLWEDLLACTELLKDTPPSPSDLFTISYTSGTTGEPKGVMLKHSAIIANVAALWALNGNNPQHPNDLVYMESLRTQSFRHLSYLPLAHILERLVCQLATSMGASIGVYQGDVAKVLDDAQALNPTVFICVPRVCNKIRDKVLLQVAEAPSYKQWLFHHAYSVKLHNLKVHNQLTHWLWDRLVFNKIKRRLGDSCQFFICGSAPMDHSVMEFMRVCFGVPVYEGYGQTETCGGSFLTVHGDWSTSGHVGAPIPCIEGKLIPIGEEDDAIKKSFSSNPSGSSKNGSSHASNLPLLTGEICMRGPAVFSGYYLDEAKTKETLDGDGWVHTGDIGRLDSLGRLYIIDRKKHIFKLAQGEYIAPERVENILLKAPSLQQIYVHGDPSKTCCVAVVVLSEHLQQQFQQQQTEDSSKSANNNTLTSENDIARIVAEDIRKFDKAGGTGDLNSMELPRAIMVAKELFSPENGLLTPTFKPRRGEIRKRFTPAFVRLYALLDEKNNAIDSCIGIDSCNQFTTSSLPSNSPDSDLSSSSNGSDNKKQVYQHSKLKIIFED